MDYKKIYNNIINRAKTRVLSGYTESHHIVPRCIGGSDDPINLVKLTPEEHYICHLLLVKIYNENISLVRAAIFMSASNSKIKRNNKIYGWIKKKYSIYMSGPNNPTKIKGPWNKNITGYSNKINFSKKSRIMFSERMKGDKNPMARIKPWNHPRASEYSKSIWKQADYIYKIWVINDKPSYCKLYTLLNNKCYINENKVIGPYMNIIKYFRKGWIPIEDNEWKQLVNKI